MHFFLVKKFREFFIENLLISFSNQPKSRKKKNQSNVSNFSVKKTSKMSAFSVKTSNVFVFLAKSIKIFALS